MRLEMGPARPNLQIEILRNYCGSRPEKYVSASRFGRAIFWGWKVGFSPKTSCFGYEHFCPLAVKVLTSAEDFVYN
jgi:hypothetical protein